MYFSMVVLVSLKLVFTPTFHWRHFLYGVIGAIFIFADPLYGQNIGFRLNDFKTATGLVVGDWEDSLTWEVWDGTYWNNAISLPNRNNNVFIEKGKEVRLNQNEEVHNLYLYGKDSADYKPGKKLNLQVYDLDVYGSLISIAGVDALFTVHPLTSGVDDWIYPETGNIVFKGISRTVVDRNSWSANNQRSSYGVIFNSNPGSTLGVNAAFKASRFVIRSGTVNQTVNYDGTPATSTFSFNTMDETSPGSYGSFVIENGATLISEGSKEFNQIIRRSDGKSALIFDLMEGGNLILKGEKPIIDADSIVLSGNVFYSGGVGKQQFIHGSMAGVTDPVLYNNIFFDGDAKKILPPFLELKGDLTYLDGGEVNQAHAIVHFTGDKDQKVKGIALQLKEVMINKSRGTLLLDDDLSVSELFTMTSGDVDFGGNELFINGDYDYLSGRWDNLHRLYYKNPPLLLTNYNSTFPFVDAYLGGLRKITLSGKLSTSLSDLSIGYSQFPGVNWNPDFNDGDTPILYQLNSYFTFDFKDLLNADKADKIEITISADSLIVENDDHLRVVADGAAALGLHLPGIDNMARREIETTELVRQILTIGSAGTASILPVTWHSYQAEELPTGNLISWSTAGEEANKQFLVLKSADGKEFEVIGSLPGSGTSTEVRYYQFLDKSDVFSQKIYYQVVQVDLNGNSDASPVFLLLSNSQQRYLFVFPNPYSSDEQLTITSSAHWADGYVQMVIYDLRGIALAQQSGSFTPVSERIVTQLKQLSSGIYLLSIVSNGERRVIKLIKTD